MFHDLIADTPEEGTTIAVTHGGTIWHGTHELLGLPVPSLGGVSNASVAAFVVWDRAAAALDRWNEVAHLDGLVAADGDPQGGTDAPPVGR